jgi:hypothetical protein
MTHDLREHKLISNESYELAPSLTFSQFQCVLESLSERERGEGWVESLRGDRQGFFASSILPKVQLFN